MFLTAVDSANNVVNNISDVLGVYKDQFTSVAIVVVIATLILGVLNCFLGYRMLQFWIALTGFFIGYVIGIVICNVAHLAVVPTLFVALIPGILVALLSMKLYIAGLFILCVVLATLMMASIAQVRAWNMTVCVIVGVVIGIIIGVLAIKFMKPVVIIATALSGGSSIASAGLPLINMNNTVVIIIVALVLAALGAFVQFATTKNYRNLDAASRNYTPKKQPAAAATKEEQE